MNKLEIMLNENGSVNQFMPDFKIMRDSYKNVLINVEVPKSLLIDPVKDVEDGTNQTGNNVRIGGIIATATGKNLQTKRYELQFVNDFKQNGIEYCLYQRIMPKEFTMWDTINERETSQSGALNLVINIVNWVKNEVGTKIEEITASPMVRLDIYPSEFLENEQMSDPSDFDLLHNQVQELHKDFNLLNAKRVPIDRIVDIESTNVQGALEELSKRTDSQQVDTITGESESLVDNVDTRNPIIKHDTSKVNVADIIDNCESEEIKKPLSANQGRILKQEVTNNTQTRHTHANKETLDETNEIFNTDQKTKIENAIKSVSMDSKTGIITFVKNDGTSFTLDTLLEKVVVNFHYDPVTKKLILEHEDNTTQEISMEAFIDIYTGVDGTEITISVSHDNKISAVIKNGSIGETKLSSELLTKLNGKADKSSLGATAYSNNYRDLDNLPNIPEGVVMYRELGDNENGALTQKKSTELFNSKLDKAEATSLFAEKLAKNQGIKDMGKLLEINDYGYIVPNTKVEDLAKKDASNLSNNDVQSFKEKLGISNLPIGTIISSAIVQNDAGLHLLDGSSLLQNGIYAQFCSWLKARKLENSANVPTCSMLEYANDMLTYGQCGKFVINDTSSIISSSSYSVEANAIKLPTIIKFIENAVGIADIGKSYAAGLPNITGTFEPWSENNDVIRNNTTGAFRAEGENQLGSNIVGDYDNPLFTFDASRSSPIYGRSNTVQPQSTKYPYYIVVASTMKTDIQVNLDNIANDVRDFNNRLLNAIYPVGSIYMSVNAASPQTFIGGTWEQLQNRFLLGAGSEFSNGNTGGEKEHTLSWNEMPAHRHDLLSCTNWSGNVLGARHNGREGGIGFVENRGSEVWTDYRSGGDKIIAESGRTYAHNNMPPYLVVYMWKRIS